MYLLDKVPIINVKGSFYPHITTSRPPSLRAGTEAGFTIMELMVVMVIMGIILTVQLPRLGGQLTGSSLRSAAQMIATMAYSARFRAANTGLPHILIFDQYENKVRLLTAEQGGSLISKQLPGGITMADMEIAGNPVNGRLKVTFHPQGTATAAKLMLKGRKIDALLLTLYAADGVVHAQPL